MSEIKLTKQELRGLLRDAVAEGFKAANEASSLEKAASRVGIHPKDVCEKHNTYKANGSCKRCAWEAGKFKGAEDPPPNDARLSRSDAGFSVEVK